MNIYHNKIYRNSLVKLAKNLPIKTGKILVTGATGLIGSCIIDVLNIANDLNCNFEIYALGRNGELLKTRFENDIYIITQDITKPLQTDINFDFIIHAASLADPKSYSIYPVETILTNIIGSYNILEYCKKRKSKVIFTSSFEVYGEIDLDEYKENDFGRLDHNIIRSCYPESKRTSELLFKSYNIEYDVNSLIARLPSVYGPTLKVNDSKAHAQFLKNALNGENIVLKSKGLQKRTYCYVLDIVSALFFLFANGQIGESYNIANKNSVSSIAEVAETIAKITNTNVIYDCSENVDNSIYSKPHDCVLNTEKIEKLGWFGNYSLEEGLKETISIMKELGEHYA